MTPGKRAALGLAAAAFALAAVPAEAIPARIVILRHGEKADAWKLCSVGDARAKALAGKYLGRGAAASLFGPEGPAAIAVITPHTLELAAPAAESWNLPLLLYSVLPWPGEDKAAFTAALNRRTQEAVAAILADPRLDGKTVVMAWEHDHIADAKLEAAFPGEKVTLRQLLALDTLPDVPATWPGENYDYFWIVDFAGTPAPTRFEAVKQVFENHAVPSNDWGKPNGLTKASGCIL